MNHRHVGFRLQVQEAADVCRCDKFGVFFLQAVEFVAAKSVGKIGLQNRVGARRSAAQVAVGDRLQHVSGRLQQALDDAGDALAMLQCTG